MSRYALSSSIFGSSNTKSEPRMRSMLYLLNKIIITQFLKRDSLDAGFFARVNSPYAFEQCTDMLSAKCERSVDSYRHGDYVEYADKPVKHQ